MIFPQYPYTEPLMRINGEISLGFQFQQKFVSPEQLFPSAYPQHGHSKVHISLFALASRKLRVKFLSHL